MTSEQLSVIKGYQKDYQNRFNDKLEIDWLSMKNIQARYVIPVETYEEELSKMDKKIDEILNDAVVRHNADLNIIKTRKRIDKQFPRERNALIEFARAVRVNRLNYRIAADLINKDRTMIYHYSHEAKV